VNLNRSPQSQFETSKRVKKQNRGSKLGFKPQFKNRGVQELQGHSTFLKILAESKRTIRKSRLHI